MFNNLFIMGFLAAAMPIFSGIAAQAVTIDLVTVGNPGNAPDTRYYGRSMGAVPYVYSMGKYEITTGQYCEFLNAVAATDTYGLYNSYMSISGAGRCMIRQLGSSGNYTYLVDANGDGQVDADWVNRPVNLVCWGDAARFCNWLYNGQPSGLQDLSTTEDGSYFLNGATSYEALIAVTRKANAGWVIPTENEWYKAAYHKNDGVTGHYWDYPTGTNSVPSCLIVNPDPGNNANFSGLGGPTIGGPYWRTEVGEFENSESPYGTFDQGGNVWEWTEGIVFRESQGNERVLRGGSEQDDSSALAAYYYAIDYPTDESTLFGFRVAYVPEPGAITVFLGGGITFGLIWLLRHRKI